MVAREVLLIMKIMIMKIMIKDHDHDVHDPSILCLGKNFVTWGSHHSNPRMTLPGLARIGPFQVS